MRLLLGLLTCLTCLDSRLRVVRLVCILVNPQSSKIGIPYGQ